MNMVEKIEWIMSEELDKVATKAIMSTLKFRPSGEMIERVRDKLIADIERHDGMKSNIITYVWYKALGVASGELSVNRCASKYASYRGNEYDDDSEFSEVEQAEENQLIHDAVNALPKDLATLVNDVYFSSVRQKKLAEELGVSKQSINQRLKKALDILKENPKLKGVIDAKRSGNKN